MLVPLNALPEQLQPRVGPSAPAPLRMMVARALVPMGPDDLFRALSYLASNERGELGDTAKKSLSEMPEGVVSGVVAGLDSPELLDFALRQYVEVEAVAEKLLLNAQTPDEAVEWAAKRVRGRLITIIGNNQERIVRHAKLVEAVYYNPEAPMAVVSRVFETAVRSGLDLHHIPGFREIYESIFGSVEAEKATVESAPHLEELQIEVDELPEDLPEPEVAGVGEDDFLTALSEASKEEDEAAASGAEDDRGDRKPLHVTIAEMNIPQKVRLALVGNKQARAILIKDSKAVVALAVLKSVQLTDHEVASFAKNKALSDRIVTTIARNREWTKKTAIQMSLIQHPKTPPTFTNRWIRGLSARDLKGLSKSRDVPGHVSRLAKNLLQQREQSKNKR